MPDFYFQVELPEVDSTSNPGFSMSPHGNHYGPWKVGAALYAFLWANAASAANVWRSMDDGQSWQQMDPANTLLGAYNRPRAAFDPASGIITVAYVLGTSSTAVLRLRDFDTATNLWGAEYAASGPPARMSTAGLVNKANGDRVLFFAGLLGTSDQRTMYSRWNGSTWSAPVLVADNVTSGGSNEFRGAAIETASQNIHVLYSHSDTAFNPPIGFYHRVLQADLTLGAITTLDTMVDRRVDLALGLPLTFFGGSVYVWMLRGTSYNAKVGSPASLPTSFTEVFIADAPSPDFAPDGSGNDQDLIGLVSASGTQLTVLFIWVIGPWGDDYAYSKELYRTNSTNGTTWSTPTLFFDYWPSWQMQDFFSVTDLGASGGVDDIGIFGEIDSTAIAYYMLKNPGGAPPSRALSNAFY
jgi:hypothetical protein